MQPRSTVPGILVAVAGLALAAWVVAGRALFGIAGELTQVYAFTLGLVIIVLHAFIGEALVRTAHHGYRTRPATIGMLVASWGCGILLGLMIPDATPAGLQTILTGASEPGLSIVIGLANPAGIIMLVTVIVALGCARGDAKGKGNPVNEAEEPEAVPGR